MENKKRVVLAVMMVVAAFVGGAVSNLLFVALAPRAEAQEAYTQGPAPGENQPRPLARQGRTQQLAQGVVTVRSLRFVDEAGSVRCTLTLKHPRPNAGPKLAILDERGRVVVWIPGEVRVQPLGQ